MERPAGAFAAFPTDRAVRADGLRRVSPARAHRPSDALPRRGVHGGDSRLHRGGEASRHARVALRRGPLAVRFRRRLGDPGSQTPAEVPPLHADTVQRHRAPNTELELRPRRTVGERRLARALRGAAGFRELPRVPPSPGQRIRVARRTGLVRLPRNGRWRAVVQSPGFRRHA